MELRSWILILFSLKKMMNEINLKENNIYKKYENDFKETRLGKKQLNVFILKMTKMNKNFLIKCLLI